LEKITKKIPNNKIQDDELMFNKIEKKVINFPIVPNLDYESLLLKEMTTSEEIIELSWVLY